MSNKINLKDLPLLIKSDRRYQIAAVLVFFSIMWLIFDPTRHNVREAAPKLRQAAVAQTGKTPDSEIGQDVVTAFRQDLDSTRQDITSLKDNFEQSRKDQRDFETRTAEIFKKVLQRVTENETNAANVAQPVPDPNEFPDANPQPMPVVEAEKLESFGESEEEPAVPAPPPPAKVAFVGAGDSVRIKLLAGVNAPTDGTPYPVVFKLDGDVLGPDGSILPLGEARLIAAAQGSLTDSRALFRLTSLNLRLPNGRRKVIGVDGWVVGEDGVRGMSGVLIDPIGKAIAGAGFTGALSGLGEGIAAANSTTTFSGYGQQTTFVSGSVPEFAAGKGLAGAANTWSDIIKERLEQMVPVVQVLSGRQATAVFAKSVAIPDLYQELEDGDFSTASLD